MLVLAHLSDTHLDGSQPRFERAARVMAYLNGLSNRVDAVLVTGDIADHGLPDEYEQARALLTAPCPVLICPGNHDTRAAFQAVLLGRADTAASGGAPVNQVHQAGGALFALCDSTIPGQDDGFLADETIIWLESVLEQASADTPVFVCCHHPPVTLHSPFIDPIRLHGAQRLAGLVDRFPQVVAILCGHAHTPAATTFAGRPLLVAPGVASTLRLPWEPGDVLEHRTPPAVAFHVLDHGRLTTHYRVIT